MLRLVFTLTLAAVGFFDIVHGQDRHYYLVGLQHYYPSPSYGLGPFQYLQQLPWSLYNNYVCNVLSSRYQPKPYYSGYYALIRGKRDVYSTRKMFAVLKGTVNALQPYWPRGEYKDLVQQVTKTIKDIAATNGQVLSSANVLKAVLKERLQETGESGNVDKIFNLMSEIKKHRSISLRRYTQSMCRQSCGSLQGQFYCDHIRQLSRLPVCSSAYFSYQLLYQCCRPNTGPVFLPTTTTTTTTTTVAPPPITRTCGISSVNPATRFQAFSNTLRQFRIVGGVNSERCEYPWMVRLQVGNSLCGGTIIDQTHVMTAAHCIGTNTAADIQVNVGEYNFNIQEEQDQLVGVSAVNIHPNYAEIGTGAAENDIAILTLDTSLEYNDCVQPICLAERTDSATLNNTQCTVIGWGTTSYDGSVSPVLQEVTVPTFSGSRCDAQFPGTTPTKPNIQICAGRSEGGADSCQGDSGGPLFCPVNGRYVQYGIVSYGDGCALAGNAGVYTDVGAMTDFINSVTNNI